jgi:hypothetical protein
MPDKYFLSLSSNATLLLDEGLMSDLAPILNQVEEVLGARTVALLDVPCVHDIGLEGDVVGGGLGHYGVDLWEEEGEDGG